MALGRYVEYPTGIREHGYEEVMDAYLCWDCDNEAVDECEGWCQDCYERVLQLRAEDELEDLLEYWSEQEAV